MGGTITVEESGLRRTACLGAVLLAGILLLGALVFLMPAQDHRFARSAAKMEALARTLGEGDSLGQRDIGYLAFEDVYREDGLVYFVQGDIAGVDPFGYVWSPRTMPVDLDEHDSVAHSYKHLQGPWYAWQSSY
ncbi:hypothetical protein [Nonomuraea lactucae]|uniref:hypothetical protein n=1 Tax=Nonomuraea lactucae TaxID=2249762 RepID=UPI0013B428B3|nr:hypothetical protein [Nonomuraea lactucae]